MPALTRNDIELRARLKYRRARTCDFRSASLALAARVQRREPDDKVVTSAMLVLVRERHRPLGKRARTRATLELVRYYRLPEVAISLAGMRVPCTAPLQSPPPPTREMTPELSEIRAAVPRECFDRDDAVAWYLVFRDLAMASALLALGLQLPIASPLWLLYSFAQGTVLVGLWVLGHECGHGALFRRSWTNDAVGFALHSFLLVPYFSWKWSHAKHHSRVQHVLEDTVHVPPTLEHAKRWRLFELHWLVGDACFGLAAMLGSFLAGWPLYILTGVSVGHAESRGLRDHIRPWSPLFPASMALLVLLSTLGVLTVLVGLWALAQLLGALRVFHLYVGPYLWVNAWLVLYTKLHHSDESTPFLGPDEWTWLKGCLLTIDRNYGVFDWFHHNIGSTHVCHNLFPKIPCYHAPQATVHLRRVLGEAYRSDAGNPLVAAWRVYRNCHYVDALEGECLPRSVACKRADLHL